MRQSGHFTVEAVYAQIAQCDPTINLATVYRTLHRLQQLGVLRTLDAGQDRLLFEVAGLEAHHHLICTACGTQQEIDSKEVELLCAHLRERYGFAAAPEHLAIPGCCAQCQQSFEEHPQ